MAGIESFEIIVSKGLSSVWRMGKWCRYPYVRKKPCCIGKRSIPW
jgi:hypothetical protein